MRGVVARRVVGRRRSVSRSSSVVSLGVVEAYHGRIRTCRGILAYVRFKALSRTESDEASSRSCCAQLTI